MCKTGCAVGEEPFAVATTIHLAFDVTGDGVFGGGERSIGRWP